MNNRLLYGAGILVALAIVAFFAFKPLTDAQKDAVDFNKMCSANPHLQECIDWKESTQN